MRALGIPWSGCLTRGVLGVVSLGLSLMTLNANPAFAQPAYLAACFHLDEGAGTSVYDCSGKGNDGTLMGPSFVPFKFKTGLAFDGNDFVEIPNSPDLDFTSAYTLEGWVRVDDDLPLATYRPIWVRGTTGPSDIEVYVQWETNDLIVAHNRDNGGTFDYVGFADPPNARVFHLAVVFDGINVQAYYDGIPAAVSQQTISMIPPVASGAGWWIGKVDHPAFGDDGSDAPDFFLGLLDEVRFWGRALNSSEVLASAQAGLRALWHFNETSGTNADDSSNYGNDGTLNGNATFAAGKFHNGLSLDGSGDFVEIANSPTLDFASAYTLEGWVKVDDVLDLDTYRPI